MSDTPRTDREEFVAIPSKGSIPRGVVESDFARQMERENAALQSRLDEAMGRNVVLKAENASLQESNTKLVGAIDMIRETLNGGNVDDILYIINTALASANE